MTGDAGTGKTILMNALMESLDDNVIRAVISDPNRERLDFYNAIAKGFGIAKAFTSKVQFLIQFSHFLHKADDENKKVLLVIDDCHRLSQDMLEELRLLSNIEKADAKLINIFFVGRGEFNDRLILPNNRAVRQRLTVKVDLASLTAAETEEYICYRLKVAGTEEKLFSAKAIQIIQNYSMGIPKQINIICDHALVVGSVQGKRNLDHKIIEECLQKLNLPLKPTQKDFEGLDDEKSHLEHFRVRFTPGSAEAPAAVAGINLENDGRFGRLKYALCGVVLVFAAVYFWLPMGKVPEINRVVTHKVGPQAAIKEMPQVISSPAVTVLGQNQDEMNDKKAAELKHTILEKAYSNGENGRQGAVFQQSGAGEVLQMEAGKTDLGSVTNPAGKTVPVKEQTPVTITPAAVTATTPVVPAAKAEEKVVTTIESAAATAKTQEKLPALPNKIVLPLAPNSLKLTTEANTEYKGFVEKLKFYPKAKLLVKGFVSSTSESLENIKLSEERALAVQKLLIANGLEAARIEVKGMGNLEPAADNKTSDGRTKNRRVEIVVVETGQ